MTPPAVEDIVQILGRSIGAWDKRKVATPEGAQDAFETLAMKLIDYFALHYRTPASPTTLPGLPSKRG